MSTSKHEHEKLRKEDIYPDTGMLVSKDQLEVILSFLNNKEFMEAFKKSGYHKMEKGTILQIGEKKITLERSLNFDETYENCYIFHRGKGLDTEPEYAEDIESINAEMGDLLNQPVIDHKKIDELEAEKKLLREKQHKKHVLGKGSYGKVKIAQNIRTGVMGSAKVQNIISDKVKTQFAKEAIQTKTLTPETQSTLRKRRTQAVTLNTHDKDGTVYTATLPEKEQISDPTIKQKGVIFMPLYSSSLWGQSFESFLDKLDVAISIAKDYQERFYKKGLIHRDIKGGNIAIVEKGKTQAKLIDFGAVFDPQTEGQKGYAMELRGSVPVYYKTQKTMEKTGNRFEFVVKKQEDYVTTSHYASPEVLRESMYSDRSDIYALGKTFGDAYYKDLQLSQDIDQSNPNSPLNPSPRAKANVKELRMYMTAQDLTRRPNIVQVLECLNTIKLDYLCTRIFGKEMTMSPFPPTIKFSDFAKKLKTLADRLIEQAVEYLEQNPLTAQEKVFDPKLLTVPDYKKSVMEKLKERGKMTTDSLEALEKYLQTEEEKRLSETSHAKAVLSQFEQGKTQIETPPPAPEPKNENKPSLG